MTIEKLKAAWLRFSGSTTYKNWAIKNQTTAKKLSDYFNARFAGGDPVPPTLTNDFGGGLIDLLMASVPDVQPEPVPQPEPTPAPAPTYGIGVTGHITRRNNPDALNARLKMSKIRLVRDDLYPGSSMATIQRVVQLAKDGGYLIDLVLSNNLKKLDPASFGPAAAQLVKQVVEEAARQGVPGIVIACEPMNEPNNSGAYQTDPAGYASLCTSVTLAVRALNLGVKVWGGSVNGPGQSTWDGPLDWTENVLKAGCDFDEWNTHGYYFTTGISAEKMFRMDVATAWNKIFWFRNAKSPETLEDVLARYDYHGPIHITETGAPTDAWPSGTRIDGGGFGTTSEDVQAAWFPRAWTWWKAQKRGGWFVIYEAQDASSSDTADREKHFGLWRSDGSRKPVLDEVEKVTLA